MVQWLRLYASNAGDSGSNPGKELTSHMPLNETKKKKRDSFQKSDFKKASRNRNRP